jgi:1-acyl-sn-glycerol-3-phosphate acyltransferase
MLHRSPTSVDDFSAGVASLIYPPPVISGTQNLPTSPRFILAANHFQRPGLWILHPAAILTQAIRAHYGPSDPPVRWIVTANWPPIKIGPLSFRSPGDILLPRVADALACYPVSFAQSNPAFTARSIRRILRDIPSLARPIGLFPEGVAGSAGRLTDPLPGIDRLLTLTAKLGLPVQTAGISEGQGTITVQFGATLATSTLLAAPNPAELVMSEIAQVV